jgi:hypothetical protein
VTLDQAVNFHRRGEFDVQHPREAKNHDEHIDRRKSAGLITEACWAFHGKGQPRRWDG